MPGENLTRVETAERADVVTVRSYEVYLDLNQGEETFSSGTEIRFDARPGASTFVDLLAGHVHEISLNGRQLHPELWDGSRIHLDDLQEHNVLWVQAEMRYSRTGEGLHRFVDPVDDEVYLYSQFEVADSRRVFAVFEQPDLKASFRFTVIAPDHWTVVSNSPTPEPEASDDDPGMGIWRFEPTPRISSYITAIVAGPYHRVTGELTSRDGRTIPLGVFCRRSLSEHLDAGEILDITRTGFAFFEEQFDQPYPFAKYDQLFVPEFNAGAMENAGAVTFLEDYVFRSKVADAIVERRAVTILHELAHMWFGNLVTMRWWNDLWLNESFAEYASTLATAEVTRWSQAWTTFSSLEKSWAYKQDQLPSTHPVVAEIRDLEDVKVNFDGITYAKGASVLKQLVAWVGKDAFFAGLRSYFATHAWGNTELTDLLRELEATSGRDLTAWSRVWLEEAGVTLLRPDIEVDDEGIITSFAVTQEAPADHPVLRPHRLVIGGYDVVRDDESTRLVRRLRVETDVDGARSDIPELLGERRPDLLLVNDEDLAYAKIRLDSRSLRTAIEHLGHFEDSLARSLVWAAAWDMTRDGELPAREYTDLVLGNIAAETDSTVIMVLLRQLDLTLRTYVAPEARRELTEIATERLWRLSEDADACSDAQLQLVRAFARNASRAEHLDTVAALLAGSISLADLTIDTDLRWDLVTSLAAGGRFGEAEIAEEARRDATATGERAAARARAIRPTPKAKEWAWSSLVEADKLPNALQGAVASGFVSVHDASLLEPFTERYFEALRRLWAQRTNEMAQNLINGLYPLALAGVSPGLVTRGQQWLQENEDAPAALRRLVAENHDGAERAVRAQAVDRAAAQQ